jgi:hypothetical protein
MPYYKDIEDQLYFLDSEEFEHLLPEKLKCVRMLDEEAEEIIAIMNKPTYQDLRVREYPEFREYIDGLVKGDSAQMQAYIDACLAIKEKYPKE